MFKALLGAIGATARALRSDESLIRAGVASLDALDPPHDVPLAARAAAFIADGSDAGVLADLQRAAPRAGKFLGSPGRLHMYYAHGAEEKGKAELQARGALYQKVDARQPDIPMLVRLGKVLAAADGGADLQRTGAPMPDWLNYLLNDALGATAGRQRSAASAQRPGWTVELLAAIVRHEELPPQLVPAIVFERKEMTYGSDRLYPPLLDPATLDPWLASHRDEVAACVGELSAIGKVFLCQRLGTSAALTEAFAPLLVELAASDGKTVRAAAARLVADRPAFVAPLERLLSEGSAGERGNAAELLARMRGAAALPALEAALAAERSKAVQQALRDAIGRVQAGGTGATLPDAPPPPPLLAERTLAADALDLLLENHRELLQTLERQAEEEAQRNATSKHKWHHNRQRYDAQRALGAGDFELALSALNGSTEKRAAARLGQHAVNATLQYLGRLAARPDFGPHQALRWIAASPRHQPFWHDDRFRQSLDDAGQADLRELARLAAQAGLDEGDVAMSCLRPVWFDSPPPQAVLAPENVWPYFAEHPHYIDAGLGMAALREGTRWQPDMGLALEVLRTFPALPARWLPRLMELALGEGKTHRLAAQDVLGAVPDIGRQVAEALASSRQEVRIEAAHWLARLGWREAVPALRAALAKENRESASAAMLSALERLGEDIAPLLAPERLLAQATKALKAKPPAGLAWLDLAALPACSWQDGTPVPPQVIQWWVVVACKLKEPGGNPLFDRYLGLLDGASRERLGSHLLLQFIAHDTRHPPHEEAVALANREAPAAHASYQALVQRYPDAQYYVELGRMTLEQVAEQIRRNKMAEYLGTAIGEKGILALASGMPGHAMVEAISQYMREHYPRRAQVEALLESVCASDDPAVIQFALSIARRYRTASVQEKARMLVDRIAARNGWTQDQLADRTIPTGGLDEHGVLALRLGGDGDGRDFTVTLDAAMKPVLRNAAGKMLAALPAPRQEDDAEAAREAKQALAQCRKEVKQVIAQQTARLYEAMCAGRTWPAADWRDYLQRHPLAGRLVQRLVWLTGDGTMFRPTEDGSLVDTNDDDVVLAEDATVQLAHAALVGADEARAWLAHFRDYKLEPLFAQMTRTQPALDADRKAARRDIDDRLGWLSDTFKLRSAFTKLGYQRGSAEDGGIFWSYHKEFPAAGIRVSIEFTGSSLPEENMPAALKTLGFQSLAPRAWQALALADVPPVLLAEAYGDYHAVAASGAFDEQWEKKVPW